MKMLRISLIFLLSIAHLQTAFAQFWQAPVAAAEASEHLYPIEKASFPKTNDKTTLLQVEPSFCLHNASKTTDSAQMMPLPQPVEMKHDCCQSDGTNIACPSCGEECVCGITCHLLSYNADLSTATNIDQQIQISDSYSSINSSFRTVFLSLEDQPPKHS